MFPIGQKSCKLEPVSHLTPNTKGGGTRRKCWAKGPSGLFPKGQKSCKLEPILRLTPNTEKGERGTRFARLSPGAPEVLARPSFNFTCKLLSACSSTPPYVGKVDMGGHAVPGEHGPDGMAGGETPRTQFHSAQMNSRLERAGRKLPGASKRTLRQPEPGTWYTGPGAGRWGLGTRRLRMLEAPSGR